MGRPSLMVQRKQEILSAFASCCLEKGLAVTTLDDVARIVGVDRTTLYNYYDSRHELIAAVVEDFVAKYTDRVNAMLDALSDDDRIEQLLEYAFDTDFLDPEFAALIDDLFVLSRQEPQVFEDLRKIYRMLDRVMLREIARAFPNADEDRVRSVTYAICQLLSGSSVYAELNLGNSRMEAARDAAKALLHTLER